MPKAEIKSEPKATANVPAVAPRIQKENKAKTKPYPIKIREDIYSQMVAYGYYLDRADPSTVHHVITACFMETTKDEAAFREFFKSFTPPVAESEEDGEVIEAPKAMERAA